MKTELVHPGDLRAGNTLPDRGTVVSSVSGNNETRVTYQSPAKPLGELDRLVCWGRRDHDKVRRLCR